MRLSSSVFVLMLSFVFGVVSAAANAPTPPPPDSTPPPPTDRVHENPYAGLSQEEIKAVIEQWLIEIVPARGPETAGSVIDIAGREVQLPDEAYIGGLWLAYSHRGPFWEIIRGDSTLVIHKVTGDVLALEVAPGDEDAFEFVEEALRKPSWAVGVGVSGLLAAVGAFALAYMSRE